MFPTAFLCRLAHPFLLVVWEYLSAVTDHKELLLLLFCGTGEFSKAEAK